MSTDATKLGVQGVARLNPLVKKELCPDLLLTFGVSISPLIYVLK